MLCQKLHILDWGGRDYSVTIPLPYCITELIFMCGILDQIDTCSKTLYTLDWCVSQRISFKSKCPEIITLLSLEHHCTQQVHLFHKLQASTRHLHPNNGTLGHLSVHSVLFYVNCKIKSSGSQDVCSVAKIHHDNKEFNLVTYWGRFICVEIFFSPKI
jgi:hypothetical protein